LTIEPQSRRAVGQSSQQAVEPSHRQAAKLESRRAIDR
jgi:hypothetical protein